MKTYVLNQIHYPSTFEPVCIITGRTQAEAHDSAMAAARHLAGGLGWSDTEWTEIAVHGYDSAGEAVILFMGSVLDLAASDIEPGQYPVCTNPRNLQDREQTWRVWIDADGIKRAGHRHI